MLQVWNAIRTLADRVACELSTIRYGSLKPEPSLAEDGSAVLVALLRPEGALLGEGEGCFGKHTGIEGVYAVLLESSEHDFLNIS